MTQNPEKPITRQLWLIWKFFTSLKLQILENCGQQATKMHFFLRKSGKYRIREVCKV
jgi:hypothetical protein